MRNVDYINLDQDEFEESPVTGFMSMMANLTRTGIFVYQKISPDGTVEIVRQFRPAEEHSEEMLATLANLPLTNTHPEELVRPENASDLIVGMTSDTPKKVMAPIQNTDSENEEFIQQKVTVFDADTIDDIKERRKTKISLGYLCDLEMTAGVYKGIQYDAIQRNIRVNHVSLVRHARGGENCKVLAKDGTEEVLNLDGLTDLKDNHKGDENVKVFNHDGKEYKVEDSVFELLTSFKTNLDSAEGSVSSKQKEIDKLSAQKDDLQSKLKTQQENQDADDFRNAVKARVGLESKASKVLGESVNLDSLADKEVKVKVISKLRPSISLDGKSDDYINARFDIVMEDYNADGDNSDSDNQTDQENLGQKIINKNEDSDDPWELAAKAKRKAWDDTRNMYKRKES